MRNRTIVALALAASVVAPAAVSATSEASPSPGEVDTRAIVKLCAANATDTAMLTACLEVAEAIIDQSLDELDIRGSIDEAVAAARDVDVQAMLDEAIAAAQDIDVRESIDEALIAIEDVDVRVALDEAIARARELGLEEALSSTGDVDVDAIIESSVETTRTVLGTAQQWAEENPDIVCTGGSVSLGTGVAAVVGFLTGSPGLALRAYEETERVTNDVCTDAITQ